MTRYNLDDLANIEEGLSAGPQGGGGLPYFGWAAEEAGNGAVEPKHFFVNDYGKFSQIERETMRTHGLIVHWASCRWGWNSFRLRQRVFAEKFKDKLPIPDHTKDEKGVPTWKQCFKMEVAFWEVQQDAWRLALWQQDSYAARCGVEALLPLIKGEALSHVVGKAEKDQRWPRLVFAKVEKIPTKQRTIAYPVFSLLDWEALPDREDYDDPDEEGAQTDRDDDDDDRDDPMPDPAVLRAQQEQAQKAKQAEAVKAAKQQAQERVQAKQAAEQAAAATASAAAPEAEAVEDPAPSNDAPFEAAPPVEAEPAADAPKLSTAEVLKARYANRGKNGQNARA